jgi:hypothetical protein
MTGDEHMTLRNFLLLAVTAFLAVTGCNNERATDKPGTSAAAHTEAARGEAKHAPEAVVPGSHEDWCGEHQVPESLCTRCNPSLAAAFKATGDWCEEHGLPESQCLICNPNLKIVRPAKTGAQ